MVPIPTNWPDSLKIETFNRTRPSFILSQDVDSWISNLGMEKRQLKTFPELFIFKPPFSMVSTLQYQALEILTDLGVFCILGTTGTTGPSKMVGISCESVFPCLETMIALLQKVQEPIRIPLLAPINFDVIWFEICATLMIRGTICIPGPSIRSLHPVLTDFFKLSRCNVIQSTPSLLRYIGSSSIEQSILPALRFAFIGGENFPSKSELRHLFNLELASDDLEICNIYGITEVSIWASSRVVNFKQWLAAEAGTHLDLGFPMDDTLFKLVSYSTNAGIPIDNDTSSIIVSSDGFENTSCSFSTGTFHLLIGSQNRLCLVGNEVLGPNNQDKLSDIVWRNSGDLVKIENNQIYWISRHHSEIKLSGHRIYLPGVEQKILQLKGIESCYVFGFPLENPLGLAAFIVIDSSITSPLSQQDIMKWCQHELSEVSRPMWLVLSEELPINTNGKFDFKKAEQILTIRNTPTSSSILSVPESSVNENDRGSESAWKEKILEMFESMWMEAKVTQFDATTTNDLMALGKDVNIQELGTNAQSCLPEYFLDFAASIQVLIFVSKFILFLISVSSHTTWSLPIKQAMNSFRMELTERLVCCEKSGVRNFILVSLFPSSPQSQTIPTYKSSIDFVPPFAMIDGRFKEETSTGLAGNTSWNFKWKHNFGSCIDSSSIITIDSNHHHIAIASAHNGAIGCVEIDTGKMLWQQFLPSRLVATPSISQDGIIVFPAFEGMIYFVTIDGVVFDSRKLGGDKNDFKAQPTFVSSNLLVIGGQNGSLYKIEIVDSEPNTNVVSPIISIQEIATLNGAIVSSVAFDSYSNLVVASTLRGTVACIGIPDMSVRWKKELSKPIFSSPLIFPSNDERCLQVLVVDVEANVYCLNLEDGYTNWQFNIGKNLHIYASPLCVQIPSNDAQISIPNFVFGSNEGFLICFSPPSSIVWTKKKNGPVNSSPKVLGSFTDPIHTDRSNTILIGSTTTSGEIFTIDMKGNEREDDGDVRYGFVLPASLHLGHYTSSTPSCFDGKIVFGSRDDYLHCYELKRI